MNTVVNLPSTINIYLIFYLAGFTASYLVLFYYFIRIPDSRARLAVVTCLIFLSFIIGCKLTGYWEQLFVVDASTVVHHGKQVALGGVFLSLLTVFLVNLLVKLPEKFYSSLGYALMLGLIIQKPGCLLAGCCRGIETGLWGISYGEDIFRHPLQLYECLAYSLALFIYTRLPAKHKLSKFFIAVFLFCIVQFLAEFVRDPNYILVFHQKLLTISLLQWIYLGLGSAMLISFFKKGFTNIHLPEHANPLLLNMLILLIVTSVFYVFHQQLYRSEIYAINLSLIPAIGLFVQEVFIQITQTKFKWVSLGFLLLPLLLMSQTVMPEKEKKETLKTFRIGYGGGNFNNEIKYDSDPDDCAGVINSTDFQQKFSVITIGYLTTKIDGKAHVEFGIDATIGTIEETNLSNNEVNRYSMYSINPKVSYDGRWMGVGFGLHIGKQYYATPKTVFIRTGIPDEGLSNFPFLPSAYLRIGPKKYMFMEYNFANHFPSPLPAYTHELTLGSGFGFSNGLFLKGGVLFGSQSYGTPGFYLSGYIPIEERFVFEPRLGLGKMSGVFSIGTSYRIGNTNIKHYPYK